MINWVHYVSLEIFFSNVFLFKVSSLSCNNYEVDKIYPEAIRTYSFAKANFQIIYVSKGPYPR